MQVGQPCIYLAKGGMSAALPTWVSKLDNDSWAQRLDFIFV